MSCDPIEARVECAACGRSHIVPASVDYLLTLWGVEEREGSCFRTAMLALVRQEREDAAERAAESGFRTGWLTHAARSGQPLADDLLADDLREWREDRARLAAPQRAEERGA